MVRHSWHLNCNRVEPVFRWVFWGFALVLKCGTAEAIDPTPGYESSVRGSRRALSYVHMKTQYTYIYIYVIYINAMIILISFIFLLYIISIVTYI